MAWPVAKKKMEGRSPVQFQGLINPKKKASRKSDTPCGKKGNHAYKFYAVMEI